MHVPAKKTRFWQAKKPVSYPPASSFHPVQQQQSYYPVAQSVAPSSFHSRQQVYHHQSPPAPAVVPLPLRYNPFLDEEYIPRGYWFRSSVPSYYSNPAPVYSSSSRPSHLTGYPSEGRRGGNGNPFFLDSFFSSGRSGDSRARSYPAAAASSHSYLSRVFVHRPGSYSYGYSY